MTKLFKTTALALAASSVAIAAVPAEARGHHRQNYTQFQDYQRYGYNDRNGYNGYNTRYDEPVYRNTRVWRGDNGNYYCRKSDGTTGLIVGAAAGALLGRTVDSRGDRTLGTVIGGALGALLGQQVEQGSSRCR